MSSVRHAVMTSVMNLISPPEQKVSQKAKGQLYTLQDRWQEQDKECLIV